MLSVPHLIIHPVASCCILSVSSSSLCPVPEPLLCHYHFLKFSRRLAPRGPFSPVISLSAASYRLLPPSLSPSLMHATHTVRTVSSLCAFLSPHFNSIYPRSLLMHNIPVPLSPPPSHDHSPGSVSSRMDSPLSSSPCTHVSAQFRFPTPCTSETSVQSQCMLYRTLAVCTSTVDIQCIIYNLLPNHSTCHLSRAACLVCVRRRSVMFGVRSTQARSSIARPDFTKPATGVVLARCSTDAPTAGVL